MNQLKISKTIVGTNLQYGDNFTAKSFNQESFAGFIDPIMLMDHFYMYGPTFDPHPHAGMSAVTYVFEDSTCPQENYDSLGNNVAINPGALHWFVAGRGAIHTEQPEKVGQYVHALQIFVNLPSKKKMLDPYVIHAEANEIPEYKSTGIRARVVLGSSNGISAKHTEKLPEPFTLLDVFFDSVSHTQFEHQLPAGWNALVYVVSGNLWLETDTSTQIISQSCAIGVMNSSLKNTTQCLRFLGSSTTHFVLLSGPALGETIVQKGPFVMNTQSQLNDRFSAYARGEFGILNI